MSKFPIKKRIMPSDLKGRTNGRLPQEALSPIKPTNRMHHLAARAWNAMRAAAWRDGILLSLTGAYRDYAGQESMFRSRYTTEVLKGRPTKTWQGKVWYQRPGTAMAAVPGTSNHGWGLAIDVAIDADGDEGFEWPVKSVDSKTVAWLLKNADRFGFCWEVQSEPWHLTYYVGDAVPAAVLAFEGSPTPPKPDVQEADKGLEAAKKHRLRRGSGGSKASKAERDAVIWLQTLLNKHGHKLVVDGDFGRKTDAAVRDFQRKNIAICRVVDGLVGPKTWAALGV